MEEVSLNELREEKIRIEGIISTHKEAIKQINEQIKERLGISPDELSQIANINPDKPLPSSEDIEWARIAIQEDMDVNLHLLKTIIILMIFSV